MHFCRSWRPRWSSTSRRRQGSWLQRWEKNMMLRIQFSTTQGQMLYFLEVLSSNSESENHWTFVVCAGEDRAEQVGATCVCEGSLRRRNLPTTSWYLLKILASIKILKLLMLIVNAIVKFQTGKTLIVQVWHSHWCVYNFSPHTECPIIGENPFWPAFTLTVIAKLHFVILVLSENVVEVLEWITICVHLFIWGANICPFGVLEYLEMSFGLSYGCWPRYVLICSTVVCQSKYICHWILL